MEFSHWVPTRFGRAIGGRLGRWIESQSLWNGNYVTREVHALSDPCRYRFMREAWKRATNKRRVYGLLRQQWVRLPRALKGLGAGAFLGSLEER